ncbi:ATP-binding protein [Sphingomonas sp. TREG-RG-20F-R18-01]|uniref:sensor histidine kinase n=1 Tax=Sphingomonas sp. TREG-RG-20F-R18-01 TaxID=2914982 RepID=UPI001F57F9E9|nr:ATP-binding protein [Sphingomonas sp. TREG-RG-20F-R18-01]
MPLREVMARVIGRGALVRWGVAIAMLLAVQSLVMAALFWVSAREGHRGELDEALRHDCTAFAALAPGARPMELHRQLELDIHRDRFLAIATERGRVLYGNVAVLPADISVGGIGTATVTPTALPGKSTDVARARLCRLPGAQLLFSGIDLDDSEQAQRIVERTLLFALVPGLLLAMLGGWFAARRAGRQIDAVRRLAEQISRGELTKRLPVGEHPDSFGQLCAHINTMLDRTETLVGEVRGIGDDIAHQLRTPLTRLRARVEREMDDAETREDFARAGAATLADVDQALAIVAALLRIHEIEHRAKCAGFATVDLAALVRDVGELYAPVAEDSGRTLAIEIEGAATVAADRDLLGETLSNLIDNAVKFGPPGGRVTLSLRTGADGAWITVADAGPGIAQADRERVFQRFFRARGLQNVPGTGLGLSLVRAIADLHGFTLAIAEQGSAITIAIPHVRSGAAHD